MKKILAILFVISTLFLFGCMVEKTLTIPKADPDRLFLKSQGFFKKEMPAAEINVDVNKRIIKVSDPSNRDYPNYIEMTFKKQQGATAVTVLADGDEQKVRNLAFLLKDRLKKPDLFNGAADSFNKQKTRIKENVKGHKVRNEREHLMDINDDGWVGPKEIMMWRLKKR